MSKSINIPNLLFFATMSTSVINATPDLDNDYAFNNVNYYETESAIEDWRDNAFNNYYDNTSFSTNDEKLEILLNFSKKLIEESEDIDSEFVKIVDDNFWDLT